MVELAANIWADGPSSDPYEPDKAQIRAWGTWLEGIVTAFTSNGGLVYNSKASLDSDLAHDPKSMAWVVGDPSASNNGIYLKIGVSGTGSWLRVADLPYSFIIASDIGAGTANAIQATTSIPVSGSALIWMNIAETNGPGPVTVQFNGTGPVYTIKTNSGNDPAAGGLPGGMIVLGTLSGTTFRLLNDQVSSAIVAAAEAAQAAAEAAQAAAEAAVNTGYKFNTEAGFAAANIPLVLLFIETAGYYAPGDSGGHLKKRISTPSPVQPWHKQSSDGAWWEVSEKTVTPQMFGAKADGVADDTAAIQNAILYPAPCFIPESTQPYNITDTLIFARLVDFTGRGKKVFGAGKRRTVIRNSTTAARLVSVGELATSSDSIDCVLSDMSLEGNALTTEGIAVLGDDDDFGDTGAQSSRGITLERLRVVNVGAGPAYRWSAWKGRMDACETEGCLRGMVIGQQVYSFLCTGFYNINCVNEAIYLATGLAASKSNSIQFIGSVLQACGASGQMILVGGGGTVLFEGTYLENPNAACTAVFRVGSGARNVKISGVNYSRGTGPVTVFAETAAVSTKIDDVAIFGDVTSYVKITGTSRRTLISQIDQITGTVTTPIDESGATTPVTHASGVAGVTARLPTRFQLGASGIMIIDRATGTPEGVETASPGSICGVRSGADSGVWLKVSGSGNTGWSKQT